MKRFFICLCTCTAIRGVSIINDTTAQRYKEPKEPVIVQQLIRPYLIDNRLW
jgi:hypothetical protein